MDASRVESVYEKVEAFMTEIATRATRTADGPLPNCVLCNGILETVLLEHTVLDRFERNVGVSAEGYRRRWVECARCGSATNVIDPDIRAALDEIAAEYYEIDFQNSSPAQRYETIMRLPPEKSDNAGRVGRTLDFVTGWQAQLPVRCDGPLRVLDIGSGLGVYLSGLLRRAEAEGVACEAQAVEPDPTAADHLRALNLFPVHQGLFAGQDEFRGYDLITLNKVIEHTADPHLLVRNAAGALDAATGMLYIEVPDVMTIGRRPDTDNILGALHHHLYSLRGLQSVLSRAGLMPLHTARIAEPSGKITVFGFACTPAAFDRAVRVGPGP